MCVVSNALLTGDKQYLRIVRTAWGHGRGLGGRRPLRRRHRGERRSGHRARKNWGQTAAATVLEPSRRVLLTGLALLGRRRS